MTEVKREHLTFILRNIKKLFLNSGAYTGKYLFRNRASFFLT